MRGESMIQVKGVSGKRAERLESITQYCVETLMPRMSGLDITVHVRRLKEAAGYCHYNAEDRCDRPRTFEIEVDKDISLAEQLITVCHEMVHAKQYARSELYENRTGKMRWLGKYISSKLNYYDLPWEIEASGREKGLFIRWAEAELLSTRKWVVEAS
tara:strand:- start:1337 stop:1810 length:474 start_codon:yes stop_codon:yes gene_type:complete